MVLLCKTFILPKDVFGQIWLKPVNWFWRRRFLNHIKVSSPFCHCTLLERLLPFIWRQLKLLHPKCFVPRLIGSGEEGFKILSVYLLSPLVKDVALHWNKIESLSPKKLARWFWRRRFLKVIKEFLLFRNYLPLLKGICGPSFKCLVPSLVENGPVVMEKKMKMW